MFAFDQFVHAVVAKASRHRLLHLFSRRLLISGCVGTLLAVAFRLLPVSPQCARVSHLAILFASLGVPALLTLLATRTARRTPDVLFELDRKLGTEARISSLHALSESNAPSVFYDRLVDAVARESEGWQRVFRASLRTLTSLAIGAAFLLAIAVFLVLGRPERLPSRDLTEAGVANAEIETLTEEARDLADAELSEASPEDWIADAFQNLLAEREAAAQDQVPQDFDAKAVEVYTAALLDSLREQGVRPLRQEELERLSSFAEAAPPDLQGALDAVLEEQDPEEILDQIDLVAAYARQQAELAELLDDEQGTELEDTYGTASSDASQTSEEDAGYPMSGYGDESGAAPSLVEAPLPGRAGETGEFFEYITGGVPIELPGSVGAQGDAGRLAVDYEHVQTILDTRALPHDAFETVRRYFELISSGGET